MGGGSIKTTLYDPCFRSTTVVQGFPAVNSFFALSVQERYQFRSLIQDVIVRVLWNFLLFEAHPPCNQE